MKKRETIFWISFGIILHIGAQILFTYSDPSGVNAYGVFAWMLSIVGTVMALIPIVLFIVYMYREYIQGQ